MQTLCSITVSWIAMSALVAAAGIAFGPVRSQPGQNIRMVTHTESREGAVAIVNDGRTVAGTIELDRRRDLTWTFREPEPDGGLRGMVAVGNMSTKSTVKMEGMPEETIDTTSPLSGTMFAMTRAVDGEWAFQLDGSIPRQRIQDEIEELSIYLKRRWYPQRVVKIGDTWEFDPAWIRHIIQRDLHNAQTIGTMRLRQIRRTVEKEIAVIDVTIRSTGGDFRGDGSETHVQLDLRGEMVVDLRSMLDERLELAGTMTMTNGTLANHKKTTLPLTLKVDKSFGN